MFPSRGLGGGGQISQAPLSRPIPNSVGVRHNGGKQPTRWGTPLCKMLTKAGVRGGEIKGGRERSEQLQDWWHTVDLIVSDLVILHERQLVDIS